MLKQREGEVLRILLMSLGGSHSPMEHSQLRHPPEPKAPMRIAFLGKNLSSQDDECPTLYGTYRGLLNPGQDRRRQREARTSGGCPLASTRISTGIVELLGRHIRVKSRDRWYFHLGSRAQRTLLFAPAGSRGIDWEDWGQFPPSRAIPVQKRGRPWRSTQNELPDQAVSAGDGFPLGEPSWLWRSGCSRGTGQASQTASPTCGRRGPDYRFQPVSGLRTVCHAKCSIGALPSASHACPQ